jgi:hypothetical protein
MTDRVVPVTDPDRIEGRLLDILRRVDLWLQFAEAKNAALVIVAGGASSAILAFLRGTPDMARPVVIGFTLAETLFLVAIAAAVLSFLPGIGPLRRIGMPDEPPEAGDNLFHYGDLRKYGAEALAEAVAGLYGLEGYDAARHPSHVQLAAQIAINSRITSRKLRLFALAAGFALGGVLMLATALLVRLAG